MKFIAFADLHIHNFRKINPDIDRLEVCLDVLDVVFAYAAKQGIPNILFAGDLFDQAKAVPTKVMNATIKRFEYLFREYPNTHFFSISGNHDHAGQMLLGGRTDSSQEALQVFPHFHLMDGGSFRFDGVTFHGVPYYDYPEHLYQVVGSIKDFNLFTILLCHVTADGYERIPGDVDPKHPCFSPFDLVLSGDIHKPKWLADNFLMLGSPIHKDAGDIGEDKGFWVIDTDSISRGEKPVFKHLKNFPVFIRKQAGEELSEWENEQHVIWEEGLVIPEEAGEVDTTKFTNNLAPVDLVTNFYQEVDGSDPERLNIGVKLIQ